jgi:glutamate racemase
MGRRTVVIASGEKLAQELQNNLGNSEKKENEEDRFFVSDLTKHFEVLAKKILGKNIKIEKIEL